MHILTWHRVGSCVAVLIFAEHTEARGCEMMARHVILTTLQFMLLDFATLSALSSSFCFIYRLVPILYVENIRKLKVTLNVRLDLSEDIFDQIRREI